MAEKSSSGHCDRPASASAVFSVGFSKLFWWCFTLSHTGFISQAPDINCYEIKTLHYDQSVEVVKRCAWYAFKFSLALRGEARMEMVIKLKNHLKVVFVYSCAKAEILLDNVSSWAAARSWLKVTGEFTFHRSLALWQGNHHHSYREPG